MDERNIPIDINLRKLLDWLISRRICNKQWHENIRLVSDIFCLVVKIFIDTWLLQKVREKIGTAIVDMPEHPKLKGKSIYLLSLMSKLRITSFILNRF